MNLPKTVTAAVLAAAAAPDETAVVRVLIRRVFNQNPYTLRGARRTYIATHNPTVGCHCLDVPLSVWMDGVPAAGYRDNESVAHDLMGLRGAGKSPLVFLVVPINGSAVIAPATSASVPTDSNSSVFDALETLLSKFSAPPEIMEGLKLAREGQAAALQMFVGSLDIINADPVSDEAPADEGPPESDPVAEEQPAETPAKRRGRPRKDAGAESPL